jgi:hypothetical protein
MTSMVAASSGRWKLAGWTEAPLNPIEQTRRHGIVLRLPRDDYLQLEVELGNLETVETTGEVSLHLFSGVIRQLFVEVPFQVS